MRKMAQNSSTKESVVLWQIWGFGGNSVITIPAMVVRLAGRDENGNVWAAVEAGEDSFSLKIRVLTQEKLDELIIGGENEQ